MGRFDDGFPISLQYPFSGKGALARLRSMHLINSPLTILFKTYIVIPSANILYQGLAEDLWFWHIQGRLSNLIRACYGRSPNFFFFLIVGVWGTILMRAIPNWGSRNYCAPLSLCSCIFREYSYMCYYGIQERFNSGYGCKDVEITK